MTDTRTALEEAFAQIHGLTLAPKDWDALGWAPANRFRRFLDAEAWTDAAMMLVPDDGLHLACVRHLWAEEPDNRWGYAVLTRYRRDDDGGRYYDCEFVADHEKPALALAAACIKAKEAGDGR